MPVTKLTPTTLRRYLRTLQGKRIAVVGDVMLDAFLWGDATRISPEAPVPVVLLERQTWSLGGAANVAANVAGLDGQPCLFSAVGADAEGEKLRQLCLACHVELGALPVLRDRPTTVKHRVFARNKHLLRFDRETTAVVTPSVTRSLLAAIESAATGLHAVVVSDYAKGCVTPELVKGIARLCRSHRIPWCVDPKRTTLRYRGATVLKPNLVELQALSGLPSLSLDELRRAAAKTLRQQRCQYLLVTRGQHGMALYGADGSERLLNSSGQPVADVTGAGDTVNAVLGLCLGAGLPVEVAARLANLAGGYVVCKPGTVVALPENLLAHLGGSPIL